VQVPAPPPPPTPPTPEAAPASGARIVLRFRGEAWTEVRAPGNRVLVSRVMRAGETFEIPNERGLTLSTGNGQNMDILVNGQGSPQGEQFRGVRRNIPLDPRALMAPVQQ
jgi:cytoskeleton protein RodZ